jgi:hypothetical protein
MIGDDLPHTPDFPGNTRRLDWRAEVDQLKADGVTIYSVHAGGKPASRGPRTRFWREMAERTGGEYLTLASIASIHETMVGILYREAGDQQLEHWAKTAGGSTTAASGEAHVFLTSTMKELSLSTDDLMRIHEALHDKGVGEVEALGRRHAVVVGRAGCRFVRIEGVTFIEQNKNKASKYARMATEGKKITWVVKLGEWYGPQPTLLPTSLVGTHTPGGPPGMLQGPDHRWRSRKDVMMDPVVATAHFDRAAQ